MAQPLLSLGDLTQERARLGDEEVLVIGQHHGALHPEHLSGGTIHTHAWQTVLVQRAETSCRNCQEVRMVGRIRKWEGEVIRFIALRVDFVG